MSFEAGSITNTIPSLPHHQEGQLQFQQHQSVHNSQRQFSSPLSSPVNLTMSTLSAEANSIMFDANANPNANVTLAQLQNEKIQSLVECVMPGIYLTKDFISWKEEQLRTHGFTHIIIIDKHIQELYYPNQQPDIFKLCSANSEKTKNSATRNSSSSLNAFDCYCPPSSTTKHLSFGKEYEVINLNFGEKSYLTTVLPNCYRAVKFINKALQGGGTILVIDCNGGEQKCLTITVAYLMYKHNISFSNAFARLKEFYKKADLDRFYISQLYEYEPILQVQRAQSRGHSCSRELHAAILKRKKPLDDDDGTLDNNAISATACFAYTNNTYANAATTTELLNNCNPLNRFDSTQMRRQEALKSPSHTFAHFMNGTSALSSTTTGGWYNWDDCVME